MTCNLRQDIITALVAESEGQIQKAKMNVEVYLHNPVGIGEHPDVLAAIQEQLDIIAESTERLDVLRDYFTEHNHE